MMQNEITKYLRNAVASYTNKQIDFKLDRYVRVTFDEIHSGRLQKDVYLKLTSSSVEDDDVSEQVSSSRTRNVIISYKTISTPFDGQVKINNDIEELTGVFFIPAKLDMNGMLSFDKEKLPWIPREFLAPMTEPLLSLGSQTDYDSVQSGYVGRKHELKVWPEYIKFAAEFFDTFINFNESSKEHLELKYEDEAYVFLDNSVFSTMHIIPFYDQILLNSINPVLYQNLLTKETKESVPLIKAKASDFYEHKAQMNKAFPLNESQRECASHYLKMSDGEILAVNGPPGTGKTTFLQTILGTTLVKCALEKRDAPILLGTSTNNQAVKNIIASFASTDTKDGTVFEERWIEGVKSFALYMPSSSKMDEEQKSGVQVDNNFGQYFNARIDQLENIEASKILFLNNFEKHFGAEINDILDGVEFIHANLLMNDEIENRYLNLITKLSQLGIMPDECIMHLKKANDVCAAIKQNYSKDQERIKVWEQFFNNLPWWMKLFKFIKPVKDKIQIKCAREILVDELFIKSDMLFSEIERIYSERLKASQYELENQNRLINTYEPLVTEMEWIVNHAKDNGINLSFDTNDVTKANSTLDTTLRYYQFWLAVHYYEGKWLLNEDPIEQRLTKTNFSEVVLKRFKRWAMITPFFVSTLFMVPNHFSGYVNTPPHREYLINLIDVLIIDEAGQVSPEIAACSFTLAKKALIIGDKKQIEPVYSVSRALDRALAEENNLVDPSLKSLHPFLNCSESNVMRVASNRCQYEKFEEKGLFLSEHRRCYDEIISFCNDLMYHGHLEPKRGSFYKENSLSAVTQASHLKPMMHIDVKTANSMKRANSRYNENESVKIAEWIRDNFDMIKNKYPNTKENELLAVITPFKAQVGQIRRALKRIVPINSENVTVGTVHTFQGAERPVVLFSTVYGSNDGGCYFIDSNPSMLNVAVSRAKDSFIVFGDLDCLSHDVKMPSGLLRTYLID